MSWQSTYAVARKRQQYNIVEEKPNYDIHDHCLSCRKNYPKGMLLRCTICNYPLRHRATRSKNLKVSRH